MTNTQTIPLYPTQFTLQWHVTGAAGGQWNGSTSSAFQSIDDWLLPSGTNDYNFFFTVKQGGGTYSYDVVFMTMLDQGTGTTYGARWVNGGSNPGQKVTLVGPLVLSAGQMISGDPRIKISSLTSAPNTSSWKYGTDNKWYVGGEPWDGNPVTVGLSNGSATVTVIDQTASTKSPHQCATYQYKDGSDVGQLYIDPNHPNPQILTSSSQTATFGFSSAQDGQQLSLNLFSTLPNNGPNTISSS
jgi:hypothetical protein